MPENEEEILIPTHLKTNGRLFLKVGDEITLEVGKRINEDNYELDQNNPYNVEEEVESEKEDATTEKIIDTTKKTYKIVGVIERPATNIENYIAPGYTFITKKEEKDLGTVVDAYIRYTKEGLKENSKLTANILGVDEDIFQKVNEGKNLTTEDLKKYEKEMQKAKYHISVNYYLINLERNPINNSSVGGLVVVVGIVITLIILTSVFCIKNSFDISITEKIKQYGMLRSVGATKKQIKKNVFYEAGIFGLTGIPLGILSGLLASILLVLISNYFLKDMSSNNLKLQFAISPTSILLAIFLGIITIYLSALKSAKKAYKITPITSIRNSAEIKLNAKKVKSPKLISNLFGIGGEISYKNLKRNKKKYRTTIVSITVSTFIFISLSSFMQMGFETTENELKISDYNLSLSTATIYNSQEKYEKFVETTKLDNIKDYTIERQTSLEYKNRKLSEEYIKWSDIKIDKEIEEAKTTIKVTALGKEPYKKYIESLGLDYEEIKEKAILFDYENQIKWEKNKKTPTYKTMRMYAYQKKDKLEGKISSSKENCEIEIGAISKEKPFGLKDEYGAMLIVSDEFYDAINPKKYEGAIYLKFLSSDADKLQDDIEELLKEETYNLNNKEENVRMMNNLFTLVGIFLYGFITVITLIGITNIFNTITTSMELRKQEFAMLKSIGMTKKEFNKMIRLEGIFVGVKSLLFGIPIGILLSIIMYHFLEVESGLPYHIPYASIGISSLAVFLLITMIMKYSMSKIDKQNTIETIRNENI